MVEEAKEEGEIWKKKDTLAIRAYIQAWRRGTTSGAERTFKKRGNKKKSEANKQNRKGKKGEGEPKNRRKETKRDRHGMERTEKGENETVFRRVLERK